MPAPVYPAGDGVDMTQRITAPVAHLTLRFS